MSTIHKPYNFNLDYFFLKENILDKKFLNIYNTDLTPLEDNLLKNPLNKYSLINNSTKFKVIEKPHQKEWDIPLNTIYKYHDSDNYIGDCFLIDKDYNLLVLFCFDSFSTPTILLKHNLYFSTNKFNKKIVVNIIKNIENSCFKNVNIVLFTETIPFLQSLCGNSSDYHDINNKLQEFFKINNV